MARNESKNRRSNIVATANAKPRTTNFIINPMDGDVARILEGKAPRMPRNATPQTMGVYAKGTINEDMFKTKFTHQTLRKVAKNSGLLQAIVSRRDFQMAQASKLWRFEGDFGFRVIHQDHHDINKEVPAQITEICKETQKMIECPWGYLEPTFQGFTSKFIKDLMVINRPVIELGLDSKRIPRSFGAIDGANIFPTFQVLKILVPQITKFKEFENTSFMPNTAQYEAALEIVGEKYKVEVNNAVEYFYMQDMMPLAAYRGDELICIPMMPTTDVNDLGYPPSMVERSIKSVLSEMLAMSYNMNYFQFGSMIDNIIGLVGSYDDEHIQEFIELLRINHTGLEGAHRVPVVPIRNKEDIQIYNTRQNNRDVVYSEFMNLVTSLATACFGMSPEEINIRPQSGNSGSMFEASRSTQVREGKQEGLFALRNHLTTCMNLIVKRIHPEIEFSFFGFGDDIDEMRKKSALEELTRGGITVREYRLQTGKKGVPENMKDKDVDIFLSQPWLQLHQGDQMAEQVKAQQEAQQSALPKDYFEPGDDEWEEPDFEGKKEESGEEENQPFGG